MIRRREPLPLGDGRKSDAARMMGLSIEAFAESEPKLWQRGFPLPDQTTGLYDLDAIAVWRKRRNPHLFTIGTEGGLTSPPPALDASRVVKGRLEELRRGKGADTVLRR